jgi:hypothetical protein
MSTMQEVKRYMLDNIEDHRDPQTGEINATTLAEDAATHFDEWDLDYCQSGDFVEYIPPEPFFVLSERLAHEHGPV